MLLRLLEAEGLSILHVSKIVAAYGACGVPMDDELREHLVGMLRTSWVRCGPDCTAWLLWGLARLRDWDFFYEAEAALFPILSRLLRQGRLGAESATLIANAYCEAGLEVDVRLLPRLDDVLLTRPKGAADLPAATAWLRLCAANGIRPGEDELELLFEDCISK